MSDVTISLRPATRDDIEILEAWDREPHVRKACSDDPDFVADTDWGDDLAIADEHGPDIWQNLIAELTHGADTRPIGIVQIIDPAREPTGYWQPIEEGLRALDIWIGPAEHLGHGYGTAMMTEALNRCFSNETVEAVIIDPLASNTRAITFYQRLGFEPVGLRDFDEDRCFVHRIERSRWLTRLSAENGQNPATSRGVE